MKRGLFLVILLWAAFGADARPRRSRPVSDSDSLGMTVGAGKQVDSLFPAERMAVPDSLSGEAELADSLLQADSSECVGAVCRPNVFYRADSVSQPLVLAPTHKFGRWVDRTTSTKAYQMMYIGVPLIAGALIVKGQDKHFRDLRQSYVPAFHYPYDDYLQYGPAALMVGLKVGGVKGRSSWGRMLVSDAFSAGIMAAVVNTVKSTVNVMRPDGSSNNSFPSGHTATAFMCATMLHKEYGWRSPWYSVAGYSMATVTGISRMLNNRHWLSDVMAGAGIGILATEFGYFFADLIFKKRGINEVSILETFDRQWRPSFLGFHLGFNVVPGIYHPYPDMRVDFMTGSSLGVEGAWFFSPYVGAGMAASLGNMPFKLNGRAQEEPLKNVSAYAGAYFSYPITARWVAGAKVLAGYYYLEDCNAENYRFGGLGQVSGCGGVSIMYRAKQNMNLRFFWDCKNAPPIASNSASGFWVMTFGSSIDVAF